ncbi:MAG: transposase [Nitrospira sp.]|nr:transposase [Nitrospira sp.]
MARGSIADGNELSMALRESRTWYNHDRPHDHLQGRTPAEVWAGIDVFAPHSRSGRDQPIEGILQPSG